MISLTLLRHGESLWNKENRFSGWMDVDLSSHGMMEARNAGKALTSGGYSFDIAYTSVLKRAIRTLWIVLDECDEMWVPVNHSWRLNERHYGALQGLNKAETADRFGEDQVFRWRRGYDTRPPALEKTDKRCPGRDPRYRHVDESDLPLTESLKDTANRLVPYWTGTIAPALKAGQKAIIAGHGNSLRALIKYLDSIPDDDIVSLDIPTGIPIIYEMDSELQPVRHYYLE